MAGIDRMPLFMSGVVRDLNGKPVPGAKVEVWHAKSKGGYSVLDSSQTPFNNRGAIIADANGRYAFRSTMPSGYSCPPGSCTQELLDLLGRHGSRPAHIHFVVWAPGFRKLTTQINMQGDPLIDDDFAFGVSLADDVLVIGRGRVVWHGDAAGPRPRRRGQGRSAGRPPRPPPAEPGRGRGTGTAPGRRSSAAACAARSPAARRSARRGTGGLRPRPAACRR